MPNVPASPTREGVCKLHHLGCRNTVPRGDAEAEHRGHVGGEQGRKVWVCTPSSRRPPGSCPAVVSTTLGSRNEGTVPCVFGTWIFISLGYFGKRKLGIGDETIRKTSTYLSNISSFLQDSVQCCSEVVAELQAELVTPT